MSFAISWSRLESFEKCPLQCYWRNYAPKESRIAPPDSPHFVRGRKWHEYMENGIKGKELPADVKAFKPMVEGIRKAAGRLYVEYPLALTEKYQKCDWFSSKAYWRTIFDVLVVAEKGVSIDWKTGKLKDEISDQLKFSSAAALIAWPQLQEISNYYVWLDHPSEPPTRLKLKRQVLPHIMTEFEERVEMVKIAHEEGSWEAKPSDFNCKWCPCTKAHCKYSRN